ncbi:MAG: hypothetical protein A2X03_12510 [Bacteroidetes bacterium GWA2_40_15]|nr:MAG: hypothetical protein A2X03_12510 [Bacteroidetes bacterium GWA2_40_15]
MIDLNILKENPELAKSVKLEISGADLLAFGEAIHKAAFEAGEKTPIEKEVYLTPAEFAEVLKISLVTLWSWDRKNITRPLRIGNKKLYRRSDLEKIMCHG